jgi:hypothetical protein
MLNLKAICGLVSIKLDGLSQILESFMLICKIRDDQV